MVGVGLGVALCAVPVVEVMYQECEILIARLVRNSLLFKNTCLTFYKLELALRIVFLFGDHRCLSYIVVKEEK